MEHQPTEHHDALVARLRATYDAGTTRPLSWRRKQLRALLRLIREREPEFAAALKSDLGKSRTESAATELLLLQGETDYALRHLDKWTAPERVPVPAMLRPAKAHLRHEPLGVVLIIGAWNYPVQLVLAPLVGALAAGNAAVLKPSESAPAVSAALARLVPQYLDPEAVAVVEGGTEASKSLVSLPFDHIFFTGGQAGGRAIAAAAAKTLTPVTLELGGKSPAVVLDGDLDTAARRIAYAKFINAGQTCLAPDYVLTTPEALPRLVAGLKKAVASFYGKDPARSRDYGRIVDDRHFDRLVNMLGQGTVVSGGRHDRSQRYVEPTILTGVPGDSALLQEEIFGPLLPVVQVSGLAEALRFINSRPHPLAAYLFSRDPQARSQFEEKVKTGAVAFDVCAAQAAVPGLPFGGVGASGTGSYHGKHSFDTFSQRRPVFAKTTLVDTLRFAYPPYGKVKRALLARALRE